MAEALGTVSFRFPGDAHLRNGTGLLEEVSDGVFRGAEAEVSTEDGRRLGDLGSLGHGLVTGELNLECLSIEVLAVGLCLGLGRLFVSVVLDEGNLLAEEVLALGEGAELAEELAESFLSHISTDIADEELGLALIFGVQVLRLLLIFSLGRSFVRFRPVVNLTFFFIAVLYNSDFLAGVVRLLLWLEIVRFALIRHDLLCFNFLIRHFLENKFF